MLFFLFFFFLNSPLLHTADPRLPTNGCWHHSLLDTSHNIYWPFSWKSTQVQLVSHLTASTGSADAICNPKNTLELTESKATEVCWENRLLSIIVTATANIKTSFPVLCSAT